MESLHDSYGHVFQENDLKHSSVLVSKLATFFSGSNASIVTVGKPEWDLKWLNDLSLGKKNRESQ